MERLLEAKPISRGKPVNGKRVDDNSRDCGLVTKSFRSVLPMRVFIAAANFLLALAVAAPAEEPKKADPKVDKDDWIDLMKPDVWKKVDDKWIFTDEVKLAPNAK